MKILQVEALRNNTYLPASNSVDLSPGATALYPGFSGHATDVATRLTGANPLAKLAIDNLYIIESTNYYYSFLSGRSGIKIDWTVENHSYGAVDMNVAPVLAAFEKHILERNMVAVVAVPDAGMGYGDILGKSAPRSFFSINTNAINVGSSNGNVQILPGSRVDIVTDEEYTSYGAPKVAAAAAVLVDMFIRANKSYSFKDIKKLLLDGATPKLDKTLYGAGVLNLAKSRELALTLIANNPTPTPTPTPEPVPTPVPGYKYFRFELKTIKGGKCFQLSSLQTDIPWPAGTTVRALNTSYQPGNSSEGVKELLDLDTRTKYCDINFKGDTYLIFSCPTPINPTVFWMTNGNDTESYPERAPTGWVFSGSSDGVKWTVLHSMTGYNPIVTNYAKIGQFVLSQPTKIVEHSDTERLNYAILIGLVPSREFLDIKLG